MNTLVSDTYRASNGLCARTFYNERVGFGVVEEQGNQIDMDDEPCIEVKFSDLRATSRLDRDHIAIRNPHLAKRIVNSAIEVVLPSQRTN